MEIYDEIKWIKRKNGSKMIKCGTTPTTLLIPTNYINCNVIFVVISRKTTQTFRHLLKPVPFLRIKSLKCHKAHKTP